MDDVRTPTTVLVAVDMPWVGPLVERLAADLPHVGADALVPVDGDGRRQYLGSAVRSSALRGALTQLGDLHGRSMREHFAQLQIHEVPLQAEDEARIADIDNPDQLAAARSQWLRTTLSQPIDRPPTRLGAPAMMNRWIETVSVELGVPAALDVDAVLDLTRVVAHNVERPAAPVTTYLLGLAVAGGMPLDEAVAKVQDLASTWTAE